jgi:hypothetical protein
MATTTNYSWTTPDDTDLVKDGAAAIRTLGSSIDTTTKALNPSTTLGDIEYRSSTANTNTRLGIGTTGQILTVSGGVPAWGAAPATGRTLLSTTTLSGATTTVSGISQDYEELYIEIANVDPASNSNLRIAPNGVTNLGYTAAMSGGGVTVHEQGYWKINQVWNMTAANTNNIVTMYVHNYTSTTDFKTAESNNLFQALNQSGLRIIYSAHGFESTSAITSLEFSQDSGNQNGGTVRIYGVK